MKSSSTQLKTWYLALLLTLYCCWGCNYNNFDSLESKPQQYIKPNGTISQIVSSPLPINSDLIIEGVVTANDATDNFYKELYIEEISNLSRKTARVSIGYFDSYSSLPLGTTIALKLKGCVAMMVDGIMTIGLENRAAEPKSDTEPTPAPAPIPSPTIANTIINIQPTKLKLEPPKIKLHDINHSLIGQTVVIENLFFEQQKGLFLGNSTLTETSSEEQINLYTSLYASFASENRPTGVIIIKALIIQSDSIIKLKINSPSDINIQMN